MRNILSLVAWIALSATAGAVGAIASIEAASFYMRLERPPWAPPPWLFGPVWTFLYVLMGVAAWLVWRQRQSQSVGLAITLFVVQLAANALWSWLFFAWHRGALAFADIVTLLVLIATTAVAFARSSRTAGFLLVPYLVWVAFAAVLNLWIWRANPVLLGA